MILLSIRLRNFRRFSSYEATFAPGFNVILGNNEEGKSTLREAISLALFQDARTSDRKVLSQRRWGADEQFAIELELEVEKARYLLVKDFQTKTARLEALGEGDRLHDGKAIEARITNLLGLGTRAVFDSTVRVTQRDVTRIQNGQEIADSLQTLFTGGEQDSHASKIIGELDKALAALKAGGRLNPGPLYVLPSRIEALDRAIDDKRKILGRAEAAKDALSATRVVLAAEQERLCLQEQLLRGCADRMRVDQDLATVRAEEASLEARVERVGECQKAIAQAEARLAEYAPAQSLPGNTWSEVAILEHRAQLFPAASASARTASGMRHRSIAAAVGIALLVTAFLTREVTLAAAPLLIVGIAAIVWSIVDRGRERAQNLAVEMRLREQRVDAEAAAQQLNELVSAAGCETVAELRERGDRGAELQRELLQSRSRLEGLLGERDGTAIEEQRKASSRQRRDLEERLAEPAMRLAMLDPLAFQRLGREIAALRANIVRLEAESSTLRAAVLANDTTTDAIHALEEERQELSEHLSSARARQRLLNLTRDTIEEARAATISSAKEVLEAELGARVGEITRGRYRQVAVDGQLNIQVLSPDRSAPVAVSLDGDLSTGTVEQIYLAARLSIARQLAGGRKPPLLLDDPFVTFDSPRSAAVLALCRELSTEHQVLLFTCREEYKGVGDHVIRLPALGPVS